MCLFFLPPFKNRHYACEGGQMDCVNYLLDQREVNVHAKDRYGATPLSEAVRKRRDNLVPVLLEWGANWVADGVGEILCSYTGTWGLLRVIVITNNAITIVVTRTIITFIDHHHYIITRHDLHNNHHHHQYKHHYQHHHHQQHHYHQ